MTRLKDLSTELKAPNRINEGSDQFVPFVTVEQALNNSHLCAHS